MRIDRIYKIVSLSMAGLGTDLPKGRCRFGLKAHSLSLALLGWMLLPHMWKMYGAVVYTSSCPWGSRGEHVKRQIPGLGRGSRDLRLSPAVFIFKSRLRWFWHILERKYTEILNLGLPVIDAPQPKTTSKTSVSQINLGLLTGLIATTETIHHGELWGHLIKKECEGTFSENLACVRCFERVQKSRHLPGTGCYQEVRATLWWRVVIIFI